MKICRNKKICLDFIIVAIICFWVETTVKIDICTNAESFEGEKGVAMDRYKNISTAPSYVKIKLKDKGQTINIIANNEDLATYLAEKGVITMAEYASYMLQHEGEILEINLESFGKFVGKRRFGDEKRGVEHIETFIFGRPLTLEQLNVGNKENLINKYFYFTSGEYELALKKEYYREYNSNPSFIALLIDLDYDVFQGDIAPILFIRKKTTPE